jgi:hypothetical protein
MLSASSFSAPRAPQQFIIYSFVRDQYSKGSPVWQEVRRLNDCDEALRRADALYLSKKFTRVEVRRKAVDATTGELRDESVKILGAAPKTHPRLPLYFAGAGICASAAFLITLCAL